MDLVRYRKKTRLSLEAIKQELKKIRENSIRNLDDFISRFEESCKKEGIQVLRAKSMNEALDYITKTAEENGCSAVAINNSSFINELKEDLIERKLNIIDAYRLSENVSESAFQFYSQLPDYPQDMLWNSFVETTDMSIPSFEYKRSSGEPYLGLLAANVASAEDGSILLLQHLKNISDTVNEAGALIFIVPIDRVVENMEQALFQIRCCGSFGLKSVVFDSSSLKGPKEGVEKPPLLSSTERKPVHVILLDDGRSAIRNTDFKEFLYCIGCKACSLKCAKSHLDNLRGIYVTPRDSFLTFLRGSDRVTKRGLYDCCQCENCQTVCPLEIPLPSYVVEIRSRLVEEGIVPTTVQDAFKNAFRYGNPWGEPEDRRTEWCKDLNLKLMSKQPSDLLYFVGCTPAYDVRNQRVARSLVNILQTAGVNFAILGNEERCCGDSIMRLGEKGLFEELIQQNMNMFEKYDVRKMVVTSPHCYNVFKHDYPLKENIQIRHYTELLWELLKQGRLKPSKELNKKVTYHDPCFLGRYNKIYEPPRKLLTSIPGLELVEMERSRENSFCCGGGGGRMWVEETGPGRVYTLRAEEVADTKVDILATACPFCTSNLEEALKTIDREDILVKDIAELINETI